MKTIFLIIILLLVYFTQITFGQDSDKAEKIKRLICSDCYSHVNRAISLPQPKFLVAAKFVNASGKVQVEVLINEKGDVTQAKVISGHPIFWAESEKAALKAKFAPAFIGGKGVAGYTIIIYNFIDDLPPEQKNEENLEETRNLTTISFGILNEKANILPMPKTPSVQPRIDGSIKVEVKINLQNGEVVSAKAVSGHPLLRMSAEKAALQTRFPPILSEFPNVHGTGSLIYKFKEFNGKTIENKNPKPFLIIEKGIVNKRAVNLPRPYYSPDINATGKVEVRVLIDMDGKVILAKAVSGHPIIAGFCRNGGAKC